MKSKLVLVAVACLVATAAADTVVTAEEVIACSVVSAAADSVRVMLARGRSRTLPAWDVYEVRLADTTRVAELAVLLPRARVVPDLGQSVPPPEVRVREAMRLRLVRARASRIEGLPGQTDVVDMLARNASPAAMTTRCRELDAVLRECGRSDNTVFDLLREVNREQEAIRGIWGRRRTSLCVAAGVSLGIVGGGITGLLVGEDIRPTTIYSDCGIGGGPGGCDVNIGGGPVGCLVGSVAGGFLGGIVSDFGWRAALVARHRGRVNDLIRRVNRAATEAP